MTSLKTRNKKLPYDPAIPLVGIYWENHNLKEHMYPNLHCSTIYKSQDMETTELSVNRWMDKAVVVHICNGILLSQRKERIWINSSEVDKPRACCSEWNKSEREKIQNIDAYTWNLEKLYWWTYFQDRNRDIDIENRLTDTVGAGEDGTIEKVSLKYIRYHM